MAEIKNRHGLNEAELKLAAGILHDPAPVESVYFALKINGVRVEIEGPATAAVALVEGLCAAAKSIKGA